MADLDMSSPASFNQFRSTSRSRLICTLELMPLWDNRLVIPAPSGSRQRKYRHRSPITMDDDSHWCDLLVSSSCMLIGSATDTFTSHPTTLDNRAGALPTARVRVRGYGLMLGLLMSEMLCSCHKLRERNRHVRELGETMSVQPSMFASLHNKSTSWKS